MADHPIIQKEVDELLAKCATEQLMGSAGFYSMYLWFLSTLVIYYLYLILYN